MRSISIYYWTRGRGFYQGEAEFKGSFFKILHNPCPVALLIIVLACINVLRAVFQHAVDQAGQFVRKRGTLLTN